MVYLDGKARVEINKHKYKKGLTFIWAKYEFVEITTPNNTNSQLDSTITNFIDNYNQLNMF